jgi:hypothetical protein
MHLVGHALKIIIIYKLPYSDQVLFLAIHAEIRLHNFIMNSEQLAYSALESVDNMCVNYD